MAKLSMAAVFESRLAVMVKASATLVKMKRTKKLLIVICLLLIAGFLIPERRAIPVLGASSADWNKDTFWYEPWGSSGVHKGVDVFAAEGTPVVASSDMIILFQGSLKKGGNVVVGLGAKWRLHYFAHLKENSESAPLWVKSGEKIGEVGVTGNAKGKPAHLHYSLVSLVPLPWLMDASTQGYKKAFYLNPIEYFGY
ncbi:M23 family metallopeptidase [Gilvimarinus sp. SDUM040013]|uniref:M23 family metallopeptidase n=1 Tax=Gilvimarinus gilvus TaxID=3058038 RepID=A0ABU4S782_9GAMM|nr:M23 family metallopeptidase [Gilvimarinus sp. SDUM040013]MDO3384510.1 M23 family metallopeptidase [Gilvimarinus sp. SDUM040013]MDX6851574.1 M23 family metallopeptidase [Gilvimarinus sp. SDUM040013]